MYMEKSKKYIEKISKLDSNFKTEKRLFSEAKKITDNFSESAIYFSFRNSAIYFQEDYKLYVFSKDKIIILSIGNNDAIKVKIFNNYDIRLLEYEKSNNFTTLSFKVEDEQVCLNSNNVTKPFSKGEMNSILNEIIKNFFI